MKTFVMCERCAREYEEPRDRRFHAQPNACPDCGPQLALCDGKGAPLAQRDAALCAAAAAVRRGEVLALKGIGGFQLLVDARNEKAVARLRRRKRREEKPLALMCPDVESARRLVHLAPMEEQVLLSHQSPILLARRRARARIAPSVAPGNPHLGVMLPYSPLHHLLMQELRFPVVATSGNLHDEPIVTDEGEALATLGGIADCFLVHDRPIERYVDDSVVRVQLGREQVLRRARGYAPLPVTLKATLPPLLAVGAHLKNPVAVSRGRDVILSQHIGDLETAQAFFAFQRAIQDLLRLYEIEPQAVVCDAHPDYLSSQHARELGFPVVEVFHHHAHMASCLADNELEGEALGVTWDGAGYGEDGTIWGGEFLVGDARGFRRVATFRPFRLAGGERAMREPRRSALGVLFEIEGTAALERPPGRAGWPFLEGLSDRERRLLAQMLARGSNSPMTSSCGRLFDAVAALLGLKVVSSFEGQAAMMVEFAIQEGVRDSYPVSLPTSGEGGPLVFDWEPLVSAILRDQEQGVEVGVICGRFHNTLADLIVEVARRVGLERVVLSGGCFQNSYLTERTFHRLQEAGFRPFTHQRVPPNDGGIALGQIAVAATKVA
jgi:hydrogenase maturation protein HypF